MAGKSNEEFQKDILEILRQHREKMEGFKKEVKGELAKKQPETSQKEQTIDKDSGYSYLTTCAISSRSHSADEAKTITQQVAGEMKELMKKYKISKLECFVVRDYE